MSLLTNIRRLELRASRLVAAVFAVAWLGLVAAPCPAAMGPLCAGSSHQGSMPAGDCDNCPLAESGSDGRCVIVAAPDCLSQGRALLEFRDDPTWKLQIGPPPTVLNLSAIVSADRRSADVAERTVPVPQASIQQRYCTYLK